MSVLSTLFVLIAVILIGIIWIAKIYFILEKSLNEVVKGLNSLDERLCKIERNTETLRTTK